MSKKKEVDMQTELFESILPAVNDKTSRYPTLLSIIPLFAAGDRLNHTTDQMNGIVYDLPDGRVRRIGPGLDVFDEDTLIAILQLGAQKKAIGLAKNMQIPVNDKDEVTTVFKGSLTASKINYFLGRKSGGADIEATRDSIRRLANQRLWFETDRAGGQEGVTDFFKYVGSSDLKGEIFVQISPQMVNILQTYQIIDMSIRRQLNDTAKAVYRYLIPQPKKFSISLEGLAEAISCDVKPKELKEDWLAANHPQRLKAGQIS